MAEKTNITVRAPKDLEDRFEEYRENHGLSKSDAGRKLLRIGLDAEASEDQESQSSTQQNGGSFLDRMLPAAFAAFLATSVFLYYSGYSGATMMALLLVGGTVILGRSYGQPYEAKSPFLRSYVTLAAAMIVFGLLYASGRIVAAGVVELAGFLLAGGIWISHLRSSGLSVFAKDRSIEAFLIFIGGVLVVTHVVGAPLVVAHVGVLFILWGIIGMTRAAYEIIKGAAESPTDTEDAAREAAS